jgi:ABC-2 type transport system ATP-binding protein
MRMKAAMASALAFRPKLIVLDEPFTGLDPLVRDELIEGLLPRTENTTVFISSHDLSEIESFASHIGYLDRGRLQFSEEMGSLAARFREIEITLERPVSAVPQVPATWLNAQQAASVFRFVDSQFEAERTMSEVRRLFGEALQVAVNPMTLRAIFVTLAKASRKVA